MWKDRFKRRQVAAEREKERALSNRLWVRSSWQREPYYWWAGGLKLVIFEPWFVGRSDYFSVYI